mgnify:CR=1 FL=1
MPQSLLRAAVIGACLLLGSVSAWAQTLQPGQTVEVFAYGNWGTIGRVQRVDSSGVLVLYRAADGTYNESTGFARYFRPNEVRPQGSVPAVPAKSGAPGALGIPSANAAPTPGTAYKVGDRVEGWNIAWYKGTVAKVGTEGYAGSYLIKHDEYAQDSYYKEANVRRLGASPSASGLGVPNPSAQPPILGTGGGLKTGTYGCGVYLSGRYTPTQRITIEGGRYTTTQGSGGTYTFDAAARRVQFQGGALADQEGQLEPENKGIIHLTQTKDLGASEYTQKWRSQICSPR